MTKSIKQPNIFSPGNILNYNGILIKVLKENAISQIDGKTEIKDEFEGEIIGKTDLESSENSPDSEVGDITNFIKNCNIKNAEQDILDMLKKQSW